MVLLWRHMNHLETSQIKTNTEQYCCQAVYSGKLFFFRLNINDTKPRLHHCITKSVVAFSWTSLMDLLADGSNSVRSFKGFFFSFVTLNIREFSLNADYFSLIHIPELALKAYYMIQRIKVWVGILSLDLVLLRILPILLNPQLSRKTFTLAQQPRTG